MAKTATEVRIKPGDIRRMLQKRGWIVSRTQLWTLMSSGRIPCVMMFGCYQAYPSDVEAYMDRMERESTRTIRVG